MFNLISTVKIGENIQVAEDLVIDSLAEVAASAALMNDTLALLQDKFPEDKHKYITTAITLRNIDLAKPGEVMVIRKPGNQVLKTILDEARKILAGEGDN